MQRAQRDLVLRYLRQLDDPAPGDAELLERFCKGQDAEAFARLVRRHGPAVLGVCRRMLGHEQDAEDVFQATFLVLARNPGAVRKKESLTAFLYGVAASI